MPRKIDSSFIQKTPRARPLAGQYSFQAGTLSLYLKFGRSKKHLSALAQQQNIQLAKFSLGGPYFLICSYGYGQAWSLLSPAKPAPDSTRLDLSLPQEWITEFQDLRNQNPKVYSMDFRQLQHNFGQALELVSRWFDFNSQPRPQDRRRAPRKNTLYPCRLRLLQSYEIAEALQKGQAHGFTLEHEGTILDFSAKGLKLRLPPSSLPAQAGQGLLMDLASLGHAVGLVCWVSPGPRHSLDLGVELL